MSHRMLAHLLVLAQLALPCWSARAILKGAPRTSALSTSELITGARPAHALPLALANLGNSCQCVFRGSCSCQAAMEFMDCISNACRSHKCDCDDGFHFAQACQNMSGVCPAVGLTCAADNASCEGTLRPHSVGLEPKAPGPTAAERDSEPKDSTPTLHAEPDLEVPSIPTTPNEAVEVVEKQDLPLMYKLVFFFINILILLLLAYIYDKYRHTKLAFPQEKGSDSMAGFSYGLMCCFQDVRMCFMGWCCWQLRWSDTIDKAKTGKYWYAVVVFIVLSALRLDKHVGPICAFFFVCVMTHYRQKLRRAFSFNFGGCTLIEDFCVHLWCGCCAVIQEARQVEFMNKH